jgi:hypothetical protein
MNDVIVLEQDGTELDVRRRRERNVDRAIAVVNDAPVEAQLDFLRPLPPDQQMRGVTLLLSNTRTGLLVAIAAHDLPGIVEGKARASAIQEIAKQLRLSREIQDDATEFVRRAERGLGVAIRKGQSNGEINGVGNHDNRGNGFRRGCLTSPSKKRPTDFATNAELQGANRPGEGIYAMTDGVTDEQFDQAIAEARAEGNLSRANVARKAKAKAKPPEPEPAATQPQPAPKKVRKTAAARRVMENLTIDINSLVFVINETNPQEVDAELHKSDIADVRAGLGVIRNFLTQIERGHNNSE